MKLKSLLASALFAASMVAFGAHAQAAQFEMLLAQPVTVNSTTENIGAGLGVQIARLDTVNFNVIGIATLTSPTHIRPGIEANIPFLRHLNIGVAEVLDSGASLPGKPAFNTTVTLGTRL